MAIVRFRPEIASQIILLKAQQSGINPELLKDTVVKIVSQLYEQDQVFLAAPSQSEFVTQLRQWVAQAQTPQANTAPQQPTQYPQAQASSPTGGSVPVAAYQHSQVYQNPAYPPAAYVQPQPAQAPQVQTRQPAPQQGQGLQSGQPHPVPVDAPILDDSPASMTEASSGAPQAPTIMD